MNTSVHLHLDADTVVLVDEYPAGERIAPFVAVNFDRDAAIVSADAGALTALAASLIAAANYLRGAS